MPNSTRILGMLLIATLWLGPAWGQEVQFPYGDELPPQELQVPGAGAPAVMPPAAARQPGLLPPADGSELPFEGYEEEPFLPHLHAPWPAPIESTSTWLERGFWYAQVDAVIWNRMWNRDDLLLAAADPQVENPQFFSPFNPARQFTTNRLMYLEGADPGQDGSVRATLGNFIFRDNRNRDHTVEFTAFHGGDWEQERVISSQQNFGLFVPFFIDATNPSFDQSTFQSVNYESQYSSFELNYRVKQRLGRDRLVMDPNGCWHRAIDPGFEREYLAGLRYMELGEELDWRAEDIQQLGNDGRYLIETENNMIGFQMGTGYTYQHARWSLGIVGKGGVFLNDASADTALNFTADDDDDYTNFMRENELSFIGESQLLGRWHITPNISLRAAYEVMLITSVALAPSQATFIPEFANLNTTGDPFYHGASFGFDAYW